MMNQKPITNLTLLQLTLIFQSDLLDVRYNMKLFNKNQYFM